MAGPFFFQLGARTLLAGDEDMSLHWRGLSALLVLGRGAFVGSVIIAAYLPAICAILVSSTLSGVYLVGEAAFAK